MNAHLQMRLCTIMIVALFVAVVGPWLHYVWNVQAINHDIFWLTTAAGRLWQGGAIGVDVYETNPPLSIYLYLPVYWLTRMGSPAEHAAILYSLLLLGLSFAAVMMILRAWPGIERGTRFAIGLTLLLAGTVMATPHFGQRDQILFFGLLPLFLMQLSLTRAIQLPTLLIYAVLISGALVLMLKPHYGLLPALVIIHRMVLRRRITVDKDLAVLICVTFLYFACVWIFVPDYIHAVLPDAMSMYVMDGRKTAWDLVGFLSLIGIVVTALARWQKVSLAVWFSAAMFCSLFVFALLHRNYMYQLVPVLSFLVLALATWLYRVLRYKMGQESALVTTLLVVAALCLTMPHSYYPSRQNIIEMPLTRAVIKDCVQPCRFMLWSESLRVTQLTARYANVENASRFPNLWFAHGIGNDARLQRKYAAMMGEDLQAKKPQKVVACNETGSDILRYSIDPVFAVQWKKYRRQDQVVIDIDQYQFGTQHAAFSAERCEIYRRE